MNRLEADEEEHMQRLVEEDWIIRRWLAGSGVAGSARTVPLWEH